jgi:SAM-dependent methyltransferase
MSFAVRADAYDRFMGRYSVLLAPQFADFAAVAAGQRVLDVGCGPGALTAALVTRLGRPLCRPSIPPNPSLQQLESAIPGSTCAALRRSSCRFGALSAARRGLTSNADGVTEDMNAHLVASGESVRSA